MKIVDVCEEVESLIKKAAASEKSDDALMFSQAATNAANAMASLYNISLLDRASIADKTAVHYQGA